MTDVGILVAIVLGLTGASIVAEWAMGRVVGGDDR